MTSPLRALLIEDNELDAEANAEAERRKWIR